MTGFLMNVRARLGGLLRGLRLHPSFYPLPLHKVTHRASRFKGLLKLVKFDYPEVLICNCPRSFWLVHLQFDAEIKAAIGGR